MIGGEKVVGGCMNREGMIFERGCDSLREEGYIIEEVGGYNCISVQREEVYTTL